MMWYLLKWVEENLFFFILLVSRLLSNCLVKKEGLIFYCLNKGEYIYVSLNDVEIIL